MIPDEVLNEYIKKYNLKLEEESTEDYKKVFMIYGDKGVGKTSFALTFPGKIVAFSFDGQTRIIKKKISTIFPEKANDIKVYNMDQVIYNNDDENTRMEILSSSEVILTYMKKIISITKPDWYLVDGSSEFVTMCEFLMRKNNNLLPFQGVENRNLWKERNAYIRQIHNMMINNASQGVIYTGWEEIIEVDDEGELKKITLPKWTDIIMQKTQFIIRIVKTTTKTANGNRIEKYYAKVVSSKDDDFLPTGSVFDITGYKSIIPIKLQKQIQQLQQSSQSQPEQIQTKQQPEQVQTTKKEEPKKEEGKFEDFFDDL